LPQAPPTAAADTSNAAPPTLPPAAQATTKSAGPPKAQAKTSAGPLNAGAAAAALTGGAPPPKAPPNTAAETTTARSAPRWEPTTWYAASWDHPGAKRRNLPPDAVSHAATADFPGHLLPALRRELNDLRQDGVLGEVGPTCHGLSEYIFQLRGRVKDVRFACGRLCAILGMAPKPLPQGLDPRIHRWNLEQELKAKRPAYYKAMLDDRAERKGKGQGKDASRG
jgi:hypothetical protein